MRGALISLVTVLAMAACDSPKQEGEAAAPTAAEDRPAIQLVVRTVSLSKSISRRAPGGGEDESWEPLEGQVYAVVTADVAHNACKQGDELEVRKASLLLPDGKPAKPVGGGADADSLCVLCEPSQPLDCSGGQAPLRPYTFVFSVPERTDVKKAQLRYADVDAPLSVAEIADKRGNVELDDKIKQKKEERDRLKKELENTGNRARGEIILGQIAELEKEIEALEKERR